MLEFDIDLQRQLITAALDDFSPNSALSNTHGGQYGDTPHLWRKAVIEFIQGMLVADLIVPLSCREGYQKRSAGEIAEILQRGDPENGFDSEFVWNVIYFAGTEKLKKLLQDLNLGSWESLGLELSSPFGKMLAKMKLVRF